MIDIVITPTNPISGVWHVRAVSQKAIDWLGSNEILFNPTQLATMKREVAAEGMTFETDFSNIRTLKVDP